jgi:hypothetical protein
MMKQEVRVKRLSTRNWGWEGSWGRERTTGEKDVEKCLVTVVKYAAFNSELESVNLFCNDFRCRLSPNVLSDVSLKMQVRFKTST